MYDTIPGNNTETVSNSIAHQAIDITISKSLGSPIVSDGDSLSMTNIIQNAAGSYAAASTVVWRDTLPVSFTINQSSIKCSATGGASCSSVSYNSNSRILTQTLSNMPANSQITVTYKGKVNSLYNKTEYTRAYVDGPCIDCIPATNMTKTNYQISGALPVTLIKFYAKWDTQNASVTWATANEVNNSHFELWRSLDGEYFELAAKINSQSANGNSNNIIEYRYSDLDIRGKTRKTVIYKLIQYDFDGKVTTYDEVALELNGSRHLKLTAEVVPNPSKGDVHIKINGLTKGEPTDISITNASGQVIAKFLMNPLDSSDYLKLDFSSNKPGIYFITLSNRLNAISKRMVIIN